MGPLDYVADRQAAFSVTANALKAKVERARLAVLLLSIVGACAAAAAAAVDFSQPVREWVTLAGALLLAIAAALAGRYLGSEAVGRHIRMRIASEGLKREAFLFAASSGPYAGAGADEALMAAAARIEDDVADLAVNQLEGGSGSCPRQRLTLQDYMEARVARQIGFYNKRSAGYARWARWLHFLQWALAALAALITAAAGQLGKQGFDYAAVTGVLTTIGGAFLSHLHASRYDELVVAYRATARRLEQLRARLPAGAGLPAVATEVEKILAEEAGSWQATFTRPAAPAA